MIVIRARLHLNFGGVRPEVHFALKCRVPPDEGITTGAPGGSRPIDPIQSRVMKRQNPVQPYPIQPNPIQWSANPTRSLATCPNFALMPVCHYAKTTFSTNLTAVGNLEGESEGSQ